jgi:DMSO/TMAO reductase YedYZ molybdopterin-dependent catalytic subunit
MTTRWRTTRRAFVRSASLAGAGLLAGCDALSRSSWFPKLLHTAEGVNSAVQRTLAPAGTLAQEFTEADLSPEFRGNGTLNPNNRVYQALRAAGFVDWRLSLDGLVTSPAAFSLAELRALPSRTQITRHDCVEGWSAIGKWKGVPLSEILARVQPTEAARYVVFHCADPMGSSGTHYYESIDLPEAMHPQTILAYELNDEPLPVKNGAPLRVRVERQLGYKMAKYLMRIELVDDLAPIGRGNGGYWEDRGYAWYAGI